MHVFTSLVWIILSLKNISIPPKYHRFRLSIDPNLTFSDKKWWAKNISALRWKFVCPCTCLFVETCKSWWRHQMETFPALLAICVGNSPVPGEFPAQRPVTRSFAVFFDRSPNKRLSKEWWGWWFDTLSSPLWRHCNGMWMCICNNTYIIFDHVK